MNPTQTRTTPRNHAPSPRRSFRREAPVRVAKRADDIIPKSGDNIRIIPLGGVEEIGKNMTVIEYKNDILVIDCGFQFKDDNTPGVDYILPNIKYLEDNKDRIRGVLITHGHLDHIGGIPFVMDRIGNPPIYTRALTAIMIKKRQEEFQHLPALNIRVVEKEDAIRLGEFKVRFFSVTHTIPDSMGLIIDTPFGSIVTPGDIKLDHDDGVPTEAEEKEYSKFSKENVLLLMMDSTNVDNPGFSTPERIVGQNLEEIIKNTKTRLIIGTFASQLERIIKIIIAAEKYGKKVAPGRFIANHLGAYQVQPNQRTQTSRRFCPSLRQMVESCEEDPFYNERFRLSEDEKRSLFTFWEISWTAVYDQDEATRIARRLCPDIRSFDARTQHTIRKYSCSWASRVFAGFADGTLFASVSGRLLRRIAAPDTDWWHDQGVATSGPEGRRGKW